MRRTLLAHGRVTKPRDTARYHCVLRLALRQNRQAVLRPPIYGQVLSQRGPAHRCVAGTIGPVFNTLSLAPTQRRVLQAVLYEALATACVAPTLWWLFGRTPLSTLALTLALSAIALCWNFGFNAVFETWEARQPSGARTWRRRALHGVGFEIGLALIIVPVMAWWLGITLWQALVADLGIMLFFLVYTVVFTWAFDQVFRFPSAAQVREVS